MHDFRFAVRQLAKSPGFTAVAVLTLAVGIASATSMFSALRALVVEPFNYPHADRLVHVWSNDGQPLSVPDSFDIREGVTLFEELGLYSPNPANLGGENPQVVSGVSCTAGVLRAFGIPPALGRWLEPSDEQPGAPLVAVISHALWEQSFSSDAAVIGRLARVNGGSVTIVGVMPPGFEFAGPWMRTRSCDIWIPLQLKRDESERGSHWLCAIGRLRPDATVAAADAEIKAIGSRLKAEHPNTNAQKPFLVRPLHFEMTRYIGSRVWMLFGSVVLVLLIACANVASMLLARSARRQGEIGVRIALGATRAQIVRLALAESVALAVAGSVLGIALAHFGVRLLAAIAPVSAARRAAITLDGHVLAFAAGLAVLTALLAGLPPAFAALRSSVAELLRTDSRSTTGSRTRHNLLRSLIVGQVAIAFLMANGAALFSASYVKLLDANRALATEYVLSARVHLRGDRYEAKEARVQAWDQLQTRIAALPGVDAAGLTSKLPLEGGSNMWILVNDEVFDPTATRTLAEMSAVTPRYFDAVGIGLLRGRTLRPGDDQGETLSVVVNRALAEKCWPGENPIGKTIRPSRAKIDFTAEVVGLVEDVRQWGPETPPRPEIYWPPERAWGRAAVIVVRSPQPAAQVSRLLRREVSAIDSDLALADVRTLQQVVDEATQGQRVLMQLVDFFMALALGLLAVGLYGTLSYHVLQRTREIGVRMAMGASRGDVVKLVFRQGSGWVLIGLALGLGGALALTTTLRAMVYGMESIDPVALVSATVAVAFAAAFACWLPARRAAGVDPMIALRAD